MLIGVWSLGDITEAVGCGGRRVFVLFTNTSGAESLRRCDSGGEAMIMKRRGRRIDCVAKFCDDAMAFRGNTDSNACGTNQEYHY